ncbi:MAG: Rrf2 family transcriptional regulator [Burkholderiaceae bacterium]
MQLTRFTDLGLRVLMYLAHVPPGQLATAGEIASAHEVSLNHIAKVVQFLAQQAWVDSQRGRGGGLALALPPAAYRLDRVVRALEGDQELIDCGHPPCKLGGSCALQRSLHEAREALYASLARQTLADLLTPALRQTIAQIRPVAV